MSDSTRDIREERRWVRYVLEWGGRSPFVHAPLYTKSRAEAELDRCEVALPICRTDRGESILQPGQVAVDRTRINKFQMDFLLVSTTTQMYRIVREFCEELLTSPAADQPKPLSYDTEIYLGEYLELLQEEADKDDPERSEVETAHLLHRIQQVEECIAAHEKIAGLPGSDPEREGGGNAEA